MEVNVMRPKPDNRTDNYENIQHNIKMTKENIQRANDLKEATSDIKTQQAIEAKNERRREAIKGMGRELDDEITTANY